MNLDEMILALQAQQGVVKTVKVVFVDTPSDWDENTLYESRRPRSLAKHYTYKSAILDLAVGDTVVVEARNTMSVAKVTEVDEVVELRGGKKLKWVIANISSEVRQLDETKKMERAAAGKIGAAVALREALEAASNAGLKVDELKLIGSDPLA